MTQEVEFTRWKSAQLNLRRGPPKPCGLPLHSTLSLFNLGPSSPAEGALHSDQALSDSYGAFHCGFTEGRLT